MIGHRSEDFRELYRADPSASSELFGTTQPVFLSTSSAWGVMEAAIRNLVRHRVLCCMCGAFSDKWLDVARRCGKEAEPLQVEWGQAHRSRARSISATRHRPLRHRHADSQRDLNRRHEPAAGNLLHAWRSIRRSPLIVDSVSSFSAVPIPMDASGLTSSSPAVRKRSPCRPVSRSFSVSGESLRSRRADPTAAIISISSNSKRTRRRYDSDHAEHRAHSRAAIEARRYFHRKA